ncbi:MULTISPECIES: phosphotransferase [Bacillus]|uniref:phosphotransferase n=1 Tax=Bacillus TaxID=1386 RepID=UPI000DC56CC6|nr:MULTISPECIES: phosphotransferase [Bacillus cereus group]RAN76604.1 hypothetical protein B5P42_23035 [Bacillus sp. SRB_331]USL15362.1 phosphotransferase [Bacillus thuringiensis]
MGIVTYLNDKYKGNFEKKDHSSSNKHYFGYSDVFHDDIFIKVSTNAMNFYNEVKIICRIYPKLYIGTDYINSNYILILHNKDYTNIDFVNNEVSFQAGRLLAEFHEQACGIELYDNVEPNFSLKVFEFISILKNHKKYTKIISLYNQIYASMQLVDEEYKHIPKINIHGDFGIRNIKKLNHQYILIDFERCRYDSPWMDFTKFLNREANTKELKTSFLKGYAEVRILEEPSELLKKGMEFLTALGIYKYTLVYTDAEFENMADEIMKKICLYFGIQYI